MARTCVKYLSRVHVSLSCPSIYFSLSYSSTYVLAWEGPRLSCIYADMPLVPACKEAFLLCPSPSPQDRAWDETNARIFPKTVQLLREIGAPTVEVFFAKQKGKTGIQPHSDGCNFVLTAHLGVDVPEGECWIKVGGQKEEWRNGKALAFDTHYFHETGNASDKDRYVLLMRFWHPGVTPKEREALQYVFDALDGPQAQTDMDFEYLNGLAEAQLASRRVEEVEEDG